MRSHATRRLAGVAVTLGLFASTTAARAQGGSPGSGAPTMGPSSGFPGEMEAAPESGAPPKESARSVKLFDQKRTVTGFELDIGPVWYREVDRGRGRAFERGTGEVVLGVSYTSTWKPFYVSGFQQTAFRAFDSSSVAWSVLMTSMAGGMVIGPFEPEVRVGMSLLTLDVFRGSYSAEMLSPRVSAGIGMHLGKIRLDFQTHSEYLWRWFGPDYLIRGVSIGLRLDIPRSKGPVFTETPR